MRRPRIVVPGVPMHIVQRGINGQRCFFSEEDRRLFLDWLGGYGRLSNSRIHAYVLMDDHVHLLATPGDADSIGKLMKRLGQRYVQYFNRKYLRSGTLWEGRYKSCLVAGGRYLFACYGYIESHPVRAGLAGKPASYRWSSYRANAFGETSLVVSPHKEYDALGATPAEKAAAYRAMMPEEMTAQHMEEIRSATNGNYVFGSEQFKAEVEQLVGCAVRPGRVGRPKLCLSER